MVLQLIPNISKINKVSFIKKIQTGGIPKAGRNAEGESGGLCF
jgi:hypothetical protein